jgi:hypothetical protein
MGNGKGSARAAHVAPFCHPERRASPSFPVPRTLARSEGSTARTEGLVVAYRPLASPAGSFGRRMEAGAHHRLLRGRLPQDDRLVGRWLSLPLWGNGEWGMGRDQGGRRTSPPSVILSGAPLRPFPFRELWRGAKDLLGVPRGLVVAHPPLASPARSFGRRKEAGAHHRLLRGRLPQDDRLVGRWLSLPLSPFPIPQSPFPIPLVHGDWGMGNGKGSGRAAHVAPFCHPERRASPSFLVSRALARSEGSTARTEGSSSPTGLSPRRLDPSVAARRQERTTGSCVGGSLRITG